jgi:hypothetical protein
VFPSLVVADLDASGDHVSAAAGLESSIGATDRVCLSVRGLLVMRTSLLLIQPLHILMYKDLSLELVLGN